jgi:hypothetical protein
LLALLLCLDALELEGGCSNNLEAPLDALLPCGWTFFCGNGRGTHKGFATGVATGGRAAGALVVTGAGCTGALVVTGAGCAGALVVGGACTGALVDVGGVAGTVGAWTGLGGSTVAVGGRNKDGRGVGRRLPAAGHNPKGGIPKS